MEKELVKIIAVLEASVTDLKKSGLITNDVLTQNDIEVTHVSKAFIKVSGSLMNLYALKNYWKESDLSKFENLFDSPKYR